MSRLTLCTAIVLEKLLLRLGFLFKRQKGSHRFYRHKNGKYTTVPFHGSKVIPRPLLRKILKQIDLEVDEYNDLLKSL